jgi:hypothetical protein
MTVRRAPRFVGAQSADREIVVIYGENLPVCGSRKIRMRRVCVAVLLALIVIACSGGELSVTEYVASLNAVVDTAREEYESLVTRPEGAVLIANGEQLAEYTPQDLQVALGAVRDIEVGVEEGVGEIKPPEEVADMHNFWFRFDSNFVPAQEALEVRAGTAADWDELSESPEMAAYRAALAEDKRVCAEFEAQLNTPEEDRENLTDVPWIPSEMKQVVEAVLGCEGYPEHPEDVYRP